MSKEIYELTVEPITCVHIGTGEKLTPLDYVVVKGAKEKHYYVKYFTDKILSRIAGDKQKMTEFDRASSSGNMKELQKFFNSNAKLNGDDDIEYLCPVTNGFLRLYNSKKDGDPLDNAIEVNQMYRPERKNYPVIPGSSIKGAIRTAVLNDFLLDLNDTDYDKYANDIKKEAENQKGKPAKFDSSIQKHLLGNYKDAKQDPFRSVEISDCVFNAKRTQLVGVIKNIHAEPNGELKAVSMQVLAEVLKGTLLAPEATAATQIRINTDIQNKADGVSKALDMKDIVRSCNYFFKREFDDEYKKFYAGAYSDTTDYIVKLKQHIEEIASSPDSFLLRVGRWSQVEFVTYEENLRAPKTPVRRGRAMSYGTTRWVFDCDGNYLPLGWCKCTVKSR